MYTTVCSCRKKCCLGIKNVLSRFMKPALGKGECNVIVDLSCRLPGNIAINRSVLLCCASLLQLGIGKQNTYMMFFTVRNG